MKIVILVLCLVLLVCLTHGAFSRMQGGRILEDFENQLPDFDANDRLQVYHLRSKLLPIISTPVGTFRAQTSGIALSQWSDTGPSNVIVLQYSPANTTNAYLPTIIGEGKNVRIFWDKTAAIYVSQNIDMSYWQTSTYMAEVNGVVYSNYMSWVKAYIKSNTFFIPQNVCKTGESGGISGTCYLRSVNGDTFSEDTFNRLAMLAVHLRPLTAPHMSGVKLQANSVPTDLYSEVVNVGGSPLGRGIADYYKALMTCLAGDDGDDYAEALNKCHSQDAVTYVHIADSHYITFESGAPFALNMERLQNIPEPKDLPAPGASMADWIIAVSLFSSVLLGIVACMQKLHIWGVLYKRCCGGERKRVSRKAPVEGGYSQSSELPTYVEWNWMSPRKNVIQNGRAVQYTRIENDVEIEEGRGAHEKHNDHDRGDKHDDDHDDYDMAKSGLGKRLNSDHAHGEVGDRGGVPADVEIEDLQEGTPSKSRGRLSRA